MKFNRVSYPIWDANSKYIYFKFSKNNKPGYIIKFGIEDKTAQIITKNADQLTVN